MSLPELETLARLRLPMLVVVYDDAAYGAEVHHFGPQGLPLELVRFPDTDFAALARAAGAQGVTARTLDDLDARRDVARAPRRPAGRRCEDHARLLRGMARGGLQVTQAQSLAELLASVDVIDLTQPLSEDTPVLRLPEPFANTPGLTRHEISAYDDRGPAWAWYWLEIGEHVGTHFDAPIHWITGRDGEDLASVPAERLVGPAVVIDKSAEAAEDPDYVLTVEDLRAFEAEHGPLPDGGWLLLRTGWDARAHDQEAFLNADETGPHTPGFDAECARHLATETRPGRRRRRDRGHRRGRGALVRPAVPGAPLRARRGPLRAHPAGQPGAPAADRRGADRGPAEARRRHRQPRPRARARAADRCSRSRIVVD